LAVTTKRFVGAIALVRRDRATGGDEWLVVWNAGRLCHQFIEAHKLDGETCRQSLIREVAWTTGLDIGRDFLVAGGPRAHLLWTDVTTGDGEPAAFAVEFYLVELMGRRHREVLNRNVAAYWISSRNLTSGIADDDRPICPQLIRLLRQADLFPSWVA